MRDERSDATAPALDDAREHRALAWAAAGSVALIFWIVRPIGLGILVGTLLAFITQPVFERLKVWIGARWAALVMVVGSGLAVAATLGGVGWLLVARGTVLSEDLVAAVGPRGLVEEALARVGPIAERVGVSPDAVRAHARALAGDVVDIATRSAEQIASATASALVGWLFVMLAMHYVLRHGAGVSRRLQDMLPLRPAYTTALIAEFRRVGQATLLGSVVIGLVQGVLATIGFWISGVPEPIVFGVATMIASFVPVVGTLLVIIPTGVVLALTGHPTTAVIELAWGLLVVIAVTDYVIRPRLVRGAADVPPLVTFASLYGGVEVFGLEGLLVGPMVMAVAITVLRLYGAESSARRRRAITGPDGP